MDKARLIPSLRFEGNCREAMEFYKSCMGGELKLMTFADSPMSSPETKDRIMHGYLDNDMLSIIAGDTMPGNPMTRGNQVELCVTGSDEPHLKEMFAKLSAGGKITMPLEKQFWGDVFGMFTDRYGVGWMMNIGEEKKKN
jgi:PhnB protein